MNTIKFICVACNTPKAKYHFITKMLDTDAPTCRECNRLNIVFKRHGLDLEAEKKKCLVCGDMFVAYADKRLCLKCNNKRKKSYVFKG